MSIAPAPAKPRTAKSQKASFLDRAVGKLASALFSSKPHVAMGGKVPNLPAFHVLAAQTVRVRAMSRSETALLVGVDHQIYTRIGAVQAMLQRVGINPDTMEQKIAAREGEGGPLIPLSEMHIDGISDAAFVTAYGEASAHARELGDLFAGMQPCAADDARSRQQFRCDQRLRPAHRSLYQTGWHSTPAWISAGPGARRSYQPRRAWYPMPATVAGTATWWKLTMVSESARDTVISHRYWSQ